MFQGYAAESNGKQVALELGGKSPHLVFEDVEDIAAAASAITWGIFYNAGQTCHGGSRLLVHKSIKDKLLTEIVKQGKEFVLGDPMDPRTQVSAIVNQKQLERIKHYLDIAKQENLQVVLGGSTEAPEANLKDGYFVQPTVIDGVSPKSAIGQEEIFGPVLAVITFETEEEAIKIANDTEYGLAASVWTSNVTRAHKVARAVRLARFG